MIAHTVPFYRSLLTSPIELSDPFAFTKGCRVLKIKGRERHKYVQPYEFGDLLFDIEADPQQLSPLDDPIIEETMKRQMVRLMRETDAPVEQYTRLGLQNINT